MTQLPSGNVRLERALAPVLEDLEATNTWMRELDFEFKDAADRRARLIVSADNLLRSMDKPTRDKFVPRYVKATHKAERRTRKMDSVVRHALEFLIDHQHAHVRGSELTWYMKRAGHQVDSRYGPNALRQLAETGQVTRTGHGVYRINRHHPEMLSIQLDLLDKSRQRAGL